MEKNIRHCPVYGEYIQLNQFLKREDIAASGGQAKYLIAEGSVKVNGKVETAVRKKLVAGDTVEVEGITFFMEEDNGR